VTGSACGTAQQCQTTKCDIPEGAQCGTCGGPLVGAGAPCVTSNDCDSNLQCFDGACGLRRGLGEPCSTASACQYEFTCINHSCQVPARLRQSCLTKPCDAHAGLFCQSGAQVCESFGYVNVGERCDPFEGPFCRGGFCKLNAGNLPGVCVAMAREGEPCNDEVGPYCENWASCTKGVCKIPDYTTCK
jgi:hypothetical protein